MPEPFLRKWVESASVYLERRLIIIMVMGFASGLPFLLTAATLSAWLSQAGVTKTVIGLMSWATSVYALKFLWAPIVDRIPLPFLSTLFGQRRSWMLLAQGICIIAIIGLGASDPIANLTVTIAWTAILAFASATQDIVIDAYRIEYLEESQFGAGAAMTTFGYRIGVLAAGGGALILADSYGWMVSYIAMAGLMIIGVAAVLLSPEPMHRRNISTSEKYIDWVKGAVVAPFREFLSRPGALAILAFIMLYKYGDALWASMANPFYLETGFTLSEVGVIAKSYGVGMTILGSFFGGALIVRFNLYTTLFWGGIAMALSNLLLAGLALIGPSVPALTIVISVENFSNGVGGVAFIAYMSSLCNLAYTATQYALMTSFMAFTRTILASGGGWLADQVDWFSFFLLTSAACIPGMVLLVYLFRRFPQHTSHAQRAG
ncbi:MAG: AmpG family muropeptide MFS transporter [Rhodospirillaceae bacterium]